MAIGLLEQLRKPMKKALDKSNRFSSPIHISHLAEYAKPIVSIAIIKQSAISLPYCSMNISSIIYL